MSEVYENYYVARNKVLDKVVTEVRSMLKAGWEPVGGISTHVVYNDYFQTMVKRKKEKGEDARDE